MALHGHEEDKSNFISLLKCRSKDNQRLQEHLDSKSINSSDSKSNEIKESKGNKIIYLSPNGIIEIFGDLISDDIDKVCNTAPCYGLIADEAIDVATTEQMALCLRFYDENERRIREEFIGFAECKATIGEALKDLFIENMRQKGIEQGYDGTANMAGKYRSVQARIRNVAPGAI